MPFGSLWLPVVISAVAVFVLSSILHMALKYHKADYKQLPDEDSVGEAVRKTSPGPGVYFIPYCMDMGQMKDPAMKKKFEDGPVGMFVLRPNGVPGMGKNLVQWFLFCFLVSFISAYIARHTLTFGTPGLEVLRITGAVAFAAYGFGYFQDSIWKLIPWSNSLRGLIDSAIYSVATGLIFLWLWPAG
jgi:hypothetical protein